MLYGSDAIAGVVNVILNDSPQGAAVSPSTASTARATALVSGSMPTPVLRLGPAASCMSAAERDTSDITSRGTPRSDAAAVAAIVGASNVPYHGFGQRWGDPDVEANKLLINAGIHVNDGIELYGFGSYMENETLGGFFYRDPVLPAQYGIGGRSTLISDANHDFLPDPAAQSLVDSIIAGGGNPANYLTADPNSPSGWALLNPIYKKFPGGYSPLFGADITDHEFVGGVRGQLSDDFKWDFHGRTAGNDIDYRLETRSTEPWRLSPTSSIRAS